MRASGVEAAERLRRLLAFHPNGDEIATAEIKRVCIRSVETGKVLRDIVPKHAVSVAISPDGRLLAVGDARFFLQLYDYDTGILAHQLRGQAGECRALAFSPDSRLLASGTADGSIRLWDAQTGIPLRVTLPLLGDRSATITPAGQLLAMDHDVAEGEMIYLIQERDHGPVILLTPREFQHRFGSSLPKPTASQSRSGPG